jgi:hypothetical protein
MKNFIQPVNPDGTKGGGISIQISDGKVKSFENNGKILSNVIYASIRQITFEALKSLEDAFPEYFNNEQIPIR